METSSPASPAGSVPRFLNEYEKLTPVHYRILYMSWAGWIFDFYDLILFTFLLIPIAAEYHFSNMQMSYVLGASLAATALGGVIFGVLADRYGRKHVLQWTILTYSLGTFFIPVGAGGAFLAADGVQDHHGTGCGWRVGDRADLYRGDFSLEDARALLRVYANRCSHRDRPCLGCRRSSITGDRMEALFFCFGAPCFHGLLYPEETARVGPLAAQERNYRQRPPFTGETGDRRRPAVHAALFTS